MQLPCMIGCSADLSDSKSANQVMSIEDRRTGVEVLASDPKDLATVGQGLCKANAADLI